MSDKEILEIEDFLEEGFNIIEEEIKDSMDKETEKNQKIFPLLAVRNIVLFPKVIMPITAGREKSIKLLQEAHKQGKLIAVISQKNASEEDPTAASLNNVGTLGKILKIINLPEGNITAIIKGVDRCKVKKILSEEPYFTSEITKLKDTEPKKDKEEFSALIDNIKDISLRIIEIDPNIPNAANFAVKNISGEIDLLNFICSNASFSTETKQNLLEIKDLYERAAKCYELLSEDFQKIELKNQIHQKTSRDLDKQQREYFLNQQIRTIQEELGGGPEGDADELREKAKGKNWNDDVEQHFQKELARLLRQNPNSPDYNVQRNYLDFFTDLPWSNYSKDIFDLKKAQKVLDKAHFGLEDIKKRILEHMAVLKLKNDMKSPILCLAGPPGVGKTSLGKSIADALGRKYIRISLGGLHDESEIRGHRKTYIGAMAGRILQAIKKAGTSNPVIVLDEIDKIGTGVHGDPSSALLEVLDPEQNNSFYDNFLEYGYDLSKAMFIATANNLGAVQRPLLDRMEIIDISGYTLEEKIEIAKRHLISKQLKENGLTADAIKLGNKEIAHIIEAHTSESGVRRLEKNIASIVRWVALQKAMEAEYDPKITIEKVDEILGVPRPKSLSETTNVPGVVTGLAWTSVGGDILFIESILSKGKGTTLTMTGNLGNVMKESATIALEYIKAKYEELGISEEQLNDKNIHVHVPEGATPKDGPSAGIAMLTSMVSSFTNKKVKPNLAMTGEITLRGKVLPVGGIKEKLLAATRAGIKDVILCEANRKDVEEIKKEYLRNLNIHYVNKMKEVIEIAL
ncbi:endopeptidase La [Elizabethkingia meningoseptica]|uniref:Lon protease n=3 Tax=Weeksellaceae TaxID=2762318 RepID=A0A1T3I6R2_ELIME|nr:MULTISPECIES: endopeptidase La [Elizabethkingia]AQX04519.1 endopeptidase La [Elizabethkingia meningoseptica]AQX46562.1 Lon protease [Elizabethkingia meningoseptica]EOR31477.1 ATP-dependent protease La [Elizabethkingia meningoseptica ATCC 13253 = NBRC 12535]KUY19076.1 Lon protease [Elizabethkingia meningoseptica]MBG0513441.1 endopeptidase La [Elizabethkingia meningoseptica]